LSINRYDYPGLLDLLKQSIPRWQADSLQRCIDCSLVDSRTHELTDAGIAKAARIGALLEILRGGMQLNTPRDDQSGKLALERWYRVNYSGVPTTWNAHAVFTGKLIPGLNYTRISQDDEQFKTFRVSFTHIIDVESLAKVEPFCIQQNEVDGLQAICFRHVLNGRKRNSRIARIQMPYYDHAINTWDRATWWVNPGRSDSPVFVKCPNCKSFKNRIVAVINSIDATTWKNPEFSS
jgi:hypothetical protein